MTNLGKLIATLSCSTVLCPAAWAQVETAENSDENIIVVTATQRASDLQDVAIAISAFNGDKLIEAGVVDVRDLGAVSPSVNFTTSNSSSGATSIFIRGVGTAGNNAGFESAVGVFVDGVYQSRPGIALGEMIDVHQVEVLRGPQGTLFGRNTSVGALSIRTNAPDLGAFSGSANATYGNYDLFNVQGILNTPVSDTIGLRFSGSYRNRDGYQDSPTGSEGGDIDRYLIRGQAKWEPNSDMSIRLIGDYSDSEENCCSAVVIRDTPIVPFSGLNSVANVGDQALDNNLVNDSGRMETAKQWGVTGELIWDLGGANLTYVGSYRNFEAESFGDADFVTQDIFNIPADDAFVTSIETITHELRLQGTAFDDRLDWLVGAYYSDEKIYQELGRTFGVESKTALNNTLFGIIANIPGAPGPGDAIRGILGLDPSNVLTNGVNPAGGVGDQRLRQQGESFSIFTHNILELADGLFLTLGLRYVSESKDGSLANGPDASNPACLATLGNPDLQPGGPLSIIAEPAIGLHCFGSATPLGLAPFLNQPYDGTFNDDELSYTGNIRYEFSPAVSAYAGYTHGFKSGGFNLDPAAAVGGADPTFSSEIVDSFEIGVKSQLFNGVLTANIALFYMDITNYQLLAFTGAAFDVFNVPNASSKGFELELSASISQNFQLNTALSYTDAKFPSDCAPATASPVVLQNCGFNFNNAPEWVAVIGGNFTQELGVGNLIWSFNPSIRYESSSLTGAATLENSSPASYNFNLRTSIGDVWTCNGLAPVT